MKMVSVRMLLTQMVIIATIMETGIIRTQMETTSLVLKSLTVKSYFSATMVNRLKVLMVIPTVIYTHSTILILEIL